MRNKALFIVMVFIISSVFLHAQENLLDKPFYYYKGEKFYLEVDYSRITVISEEKFDANIKSKIAFSIKNGGISHTKQTIVLLNENDKMMQDKEIFITEVEFSEVLNQPDYKDIIRQFDNIDNVVKAMPLYTVSGQNVGISNNFYVKLFNKKDQNKLFDLAKKYSIQVLGYNEFMPLWFTLSCGKESPLNALELANIFYETGLFECAEPELLYHNLLASNDQYFSNQWGLKNTGQHCNISNVDICAENAWNITKGSSNIRIAVFDQGIKMDHPDLISNIYGTGYDAETNTTPSILRSDHGTPCAGIVAAQQNNIAGISGVAPSSKLISISINLTWSNTPQQLANGFNWAWQNGADVISNSWGGYAPAAIIDDAITNAQSQGRNGLGCVLVFCTHNYNSAVVDTANLPNVIGVGAVSTSGQRKSPLSCDGEDWWGSNYGNGLDVVAPGVFIPTTTWNGGYTQTFNGTSSATPHVAGIAALILSVNPDLTAKQVRDIIEQTAQKVGGYTYANFAAHPNGPWHEQMGYGLVNAYEAVKRAACTTCPYPYISLTGTQPPPPQTYKSVICNEITIQNATVPAGSTLILDACHKTTINAGFKVEAGAAFIVR